MDFETNLYYQEIHQQRQHSKSRWARELQRCILPCLELSEHSTNHRIKGRLEINVGEILWLKENPFKIDDSVFLDILIRDPISNELCHVGKLCGRLSCETGDTIINERLSFPFWLEVSTELVALVSNGDRIFGVLCYPLKSVFDVGRADLDLIIRDVLGNDAGVVDLNFRFRRPESPISYSSR